MVSPRGPLPSVLWARGPDEHLVTARVPRLSGLAEEGEPGSWSRRQGCGCRFRGVWTVVSKTWAHLQAWTMPLTLKSVPRTSRTVQPRPRPRAGHARARDRYRNHSAEEAGRDLRPRRRPDFLFKRNTRLSPHLEAGRGPEPHRTHRKAPGIRHQRPRASEGRRVRTRPAARAHRASSALRGEGGHSGHRQTPPAEKWGRTSQPHLAATTFRNRIETSTAWTPHQRGGDGRKRNGLENTVVATICNNRKKTIGKYKQSSGTWAMIREA